MFGLFACLASLPGMGGTTVGNYTLGRPLGAGLIVGIIMGDIQSGILVGAAIQVVYIALVTSGGTVSTDVRAVSYIGIPLAVAARHSFIVPTATMTVHPVRHSGMVLGVPQTLRYFEQMQERIVSFVAGHSGISARRFTQLMHNTGELVMDMGTGLGGEQAVEEGLIDAIGNLGDALRYLYAEIDAGKTGY